MEHHLNQLEEELEHLLTERKVLLQQIYDLRNSSQSEYTSATLADKAQQLKGVEKQLFDVSISLSALHSLIESRKILIEKDILNAQLAHLSKSSIIQ